MGRGKKFLSLFLAVAMTITGINFGAPSVAEAAESAVTMPKKLAHFSFDENVTDGTVVSGDDGTVSGGAGTEKPMTVTATPTGSNVSVDTQDKRIGAGALHLNGQSYLTIAGEDGDNLLAGRNQLTFSFWCKNQVDGNNNWVFFASRNDENNSPNQEHYIGMTLRNSIAFERWNNSGTRTPVINVDVTNTAWNYVTVVMDDTSSQIYLNGEKKGELGEQARLTDILNAGSKLHLGKANWGGGEFYKGWIDEFSIYEGALTEAQAKAEYDAFFEPVTVNFKCEGKVLETRTERWYDETSSTYIYALKDEDQVLVKGNDVYVRADSQNLTINDKNTEIDVIYTKAEAESVTGTYSAETRVGVAPKDLPKMVSIKLKGVENAVMAPVTWTVTEESYAKAGQATINGVAAGITATLTLTVKDKEEYLIADYSFDETDITSGWADKKGKDAAVADGSAKDGITSVPGLKGNAVKLPGGKADTAAVKLPDNLLSDAEGAVDDFTVSMFINRESNGATFAMSLLGSDGHKNPAEHYIGLINRDGVLEVGYQLNSAGPTVKSLDPSETEIGEWVHFAIVTSASTDEAWLYINGKKVGYINNMRLTPSELAQKNNFLGRSAWPDNDYAGTFDEFKVYSAALTENEVKDICNETLYDAQIEKTKADLQITYAEGETQSSVTQNLTLPTVGTGLGTSVEWSTSNEKVVKADGTVMRPSKSKGDTPVTLTATIKAKGYDKTDTKEFVVTVKALDGVSFEALKQAIKDGEAIYNKAVTDNIYKESSLEELKAAIDAAKLVAEKENQTGTDVTDKEVDDATDAMMSAIAKGLDLKTFEELNKTTLLAWYPLTEDAKDKTGNRDHDGTPGENISFSREMGATFSGGEAFDSCIQLPVENLTVARRMTFSFWAYDERGERSNAFGLGSGDVFGSELPEGKQYAHLFYINTNDNGKLLASMNPKYWASGTTVNINTTAAEANTWHHIVCVMDDTVMTLYVNGEKIATKDVKHSLTEMWNADPNTRWAYIGNCGWANNEANRDKDYKGSIKDFRVYNTALADSQVAEITEYMIGLPMEYAKSDLLKAMKSNTVNGKNHVNVTTDKITLPTTGEQEETITWKSDKENINVVTGDVTFPASGSITVKLTATITLKDGTTAEVEFECLVAKPAENLDLTALESAVSKGEALADKENEYLTDAWNNFKAKLAAAKSVLELPLSQEDVDQAASDLEEAITALNNAKRGDKTELLKTIQRANILVDDTTLPYPDEARAALREALQKARTVNTNQDATQAQVDEAVQDLEEAITAFENSVPQDQRPATKDDVDNLTAKIAEAESLIDDERYTEEAIADFNEALDTLKEVAAKEGVTKGEIDQALEDLQNAVDAFKETADAATSAEKTELTNKIDEAAEIDTSNYSQASVALFNKALDALREIAAKEGVTKGEIAQALADLNKAVAALEASNDPATEEEKEQLTAEISNAAAIDETKYPKNAVDTFKAALEAIRKVAEKEGVTKGEIAQALEDLKTAVAELKKTEGTVPTVDKSKLAAAIAAAEKLVQANYTKESWAPFQAALNTAKTINAKADATQQEVDSALAALNTAQSGLKEAPSAPQGPVKVNKVTITNGKTLKIAAGKKVKLVASVAPSNATNKAVTWSIAKKDKKYASVNSKGQLTTKKAGAGKKVTVTATAKDGSGKKATVKVTIMKNAVTKVTLKAKTKKVKAGKKLTIKATVKTNGKKVNKVLAWSVDKKSQKFASVNKKGVLTTKKAGKGKTVTVTAVSTDGTNKKGTIKIKLTK